MARIFVIEDDPSVARELVRLLERRGHEARAAGRFDRLVADALAAEPDAVLLDLNLPGTDGQRVCHDLRQASDVPVVVVTSRAGELDELMSMQLGADDFVQKPYNGAVLLAHLDAVLRRRAPQAAGSVLAWRGLTLDLARSRAAFGGREVELTKNELRILALLMEGEGSIVPREQIMVELWSSDEFVDDNTLTVNMNRLRKTLASIGVEDYVRTHRGQGYSA